MKKFLAVVSFFVAACLPFGAEHNFFNFIKNEIRNGSVEFPVHKVADLSWDKVCLLYDHNITPFEDLEDNGVTEVPLEHHRQKIQKISDQSDIAIFVFSTNSQVVEVFYYPREEFQIDGLTYSFSYNESKCISHSEAYFQVQDKSHSKSKYLVLTKRNS